MKGNTQVSHDQFGFISWDWGRGVIGLIVLWLHLERSCITGLGGVQPVIEKCGLHSERGSRAYWFCFSAFLFLFFLFLNDTDVSSEKSKFQIRKQFSHKSMTMVPFNIHISFLSKKRNSLWKVKQKSDVILMPNWSISEFCIKSFQKYLFIFFLYVN